MIPFGPGTTIGDKYESKNVGGEFMFEFDVERLSAVKGQIVDFYMRNGNGTNIAKISVSSTRITCYWYNNSKPTEYAYSSVSGESHKIRLLLGTENEKQYLGGLWIDDKGISDKKQVITDYTSDGWKVIAAAPATKWVTGDMCKIDNIKVWRSAEDQAKELAAAEAGKITFEQIKGKNETAQNITEDLELKYGKENALQTENKLLVMGWKSDKPEIISESGKVTYPTKGVEEVSLIPILAIQGSQTGEYITVDGEPIIVTVKMKQALFLDENSKEVTVLNSLITQGAADISSFSGTVALYAALYNGEELEKVWMSKTTAENSIATVDIKLPEDLNGKQLKLFVWNNDTLEPLYNPVQVHN